MTTPPDVDSAAATAPASDGPESSVARVTVSVGALVWLAAGALFVLLRLGALLSLPVWGPELEHLSGAWRARLGEGDHRFVPTLFQALSALLLHVSTDEWPSRLLALAASATIPVAVYRLRPYLGEGGALLALVILALDPAGIVLGASASAMAFDLALAAWFFVLLLEPPRSGLTWLIGGFLIAASGPLTLPLLAAALVLGLARRSYPPLDGLAWSAAGAALALLVASARFGVGFDGFRVPPFDLFADSYDSPWSTANTGELLVDYILPIVVAGGLVVAWHLGSWTRRPPTAAVAVLVAWAVVAGLWLVSSLTAHNPAALAAVTLPLALLLGPAVAEGFARLRFADWRLPRLVLPAAAIIALLAVAPVLDWARLERAGSSTEQVRVVLLLVLALLLLAVLATNRRTAPTLVIPAVAVGALWLGVGTFGPVNGTQPEPIASPWSPPQARDLRDIALSYARNHGGSVVVHPALEAAATWPFRDSGQLVIASQPPTDAAVLVWPATLPRPQGFEPLAGSWALVRSISPPNNDFLDYLHWLVDRNTLQITSSGIAVYLKASP